MKWFHGEVCSETGEVFKFRYGEPDHTSIHQCIHNIITRYLKHSNVTILWIEEGFIPKDTEEWGGWEMMEPDEFTELVVEQRENV